MIKKWIEKREMCFGNIFHPPSSVAFYACENAAKYSTIPMSYISMQQ